MEYFFTDEQKRIKNLAATIAREQISPIAIEYDAEGTFPNKIYDIFGKSGLCGIYIDKKYGGLGGGILDMALAVEELSKECAGITASFAATALGTFPIILFGSDEQKQQYLPEIASGKKIVAFGLTEPNAGSDISKIETTAVLDGNEYILNGKKQWISNAGEADVYTVIACTNKSKGARGLSAFIVEKDTPGFSFGKTENKMGIRASCTRELVFENCRIPKENIIQKEGMGFVTAMRTFDRTRPIVASQALGIADGAFNEALRYSQTREQFGQPIASFQAIQHMLADMAMQIEATRCLVYQTCKHIDNGANKISKEASMSKVMASDVAMRVTVDAVQILGGYGYMKEYPIEKRMRDAKITQIYEGTNQIQRNIIALELLKEVATEI